MPHRTNNNPIQSQIEAYLDQVLGQVSGKRTYDIINRGYDPGGPEQLPKYNFDIIRDDVDEVMSVGLELGAPNNLQHQRTVRLVNDENQQLVRGRWVGDQIQDPAYTGGPLMDPWTDVGRRLHKGFEISKYDDYISPNKGLTQVNAGYYDRQTNEYFPELERVGAIQSEQQLHLQESSVVDIGIPGVAKPTGGQRLYIDEVREMLQHDQQKVGQAPWNKQISTHATYRPAEAGKKPVLVSPNYYGIEQTSTNSGLAPDKESAFDKRVTSRGAREDASAWRTDSRGIWRRVKPASANSDPVLNQWRESSVILPGRTTASQGLYTQSATSKDMLSAVPGSSVLDTRGMEVETFGLASTRRPMQIKAEDLNSLINAEGKSRITLESGLMGKKFTKGSEITVGHLEGEDGEKTPLTINAGARDFIFEKNAYISLPNREDIGDSVAASLEAAFKESKVRYRFNGGSINSEGRLAKVVVPGAGSTNVSFKKSGKNSPLGLPFDMDDPANTIELPSGENMRIGHLKEWKSPEYSFLNTLAAFTPKQVRGFLNEFGQAQGDNAADLIKYHLKGDNVSRGGKLDLGVLQERYNAMTGGKSTFQQDLWGFVQSGMNNEETNADWLERYGMGKVHGTLSLGKFSEAQRDTFLETRRAAAKAVAEQHGLDSQDVLSRTTGLLNFDKLSNNEYMGRQTGDFFVRPELEQPVPEMMGRGQYGYPEITALEAAGFSGYASKAGAEYTLDPVQALKNSSLDPAWWHRAAMRSGFGSDEGFLGVGGMQMPGNTAMTAETAAKIDRIIAGAGGEDPIKTVQKIGSLWSGIAGTKEGEYSGMGFGGNLQLTDPNAILATDVEDPFTGGTKAQESRLYLDALKDAFSVADDSKNLRSVLAGYYGRSRHFESKGEVMKKMQSTTNRSMISNRYEGSRRVRRNEVIAGDETLMSMFGKQLGLEGRKDAYDSKEFQDFKDFIKQNKGIAGVSFRYPTLRRGSEETPTAVPVIIKTADMIRGGRSDSALKRGSVLVGSLFSSLTQGDEDDDELVLDAQVQTRRNKQGELVHSQDKSDALYQRARAYQNRPGVFRNMISQLNKSLFKGATPEEEYAFGGGDPLRAQMQEQMEIALGLTSKTAFSSKTQPTTMKKVDEAAAAHSDAMIHRGTSYNTYLRSIEAVMSENQRFTPQEIGGAMDEHMMQYQQSLDSTRSGTSAETIINSARFIPSDTGAGKMSMWYIPSKGADPRKAQTPEQFLKSLATHYTETEMITNEGLAYGFSSSGKQARQLSRALNRLETPEQRTMLLHRQIEKGKIDMTGNVPRMIMSETAHNSATKRYDDGSLGTTALAGLSFGGKTLDQWTEDTGQVRTMFQMLKREGLPRIEKLIQATRSFAGTAAGKLPGMMLAGMGVKPEDYTEAEAQIAANREAQAQELGQHYQGDSQSIGLSASVIAQLVKGDDAQTAMQRAIIQRIDEDPNAPRIPTSDGKTVYLKDILTDANEDQSHLERGKKFEAAVAASKDIREELGLGLHVGQGGKFTVRGGLGTKEGTFKKPFTTGNVDFFAPQYDKKGNIVGVGLVDAKSFDTTNKKTAAEVDQILAGHSNPRAESIRFQGLLSKKAIEQMSEEELRASLEKYEKDDEAKHGGARPKFDAAAVAKYMKSDDAYLFPAALLNDQREGKQPYTMVNLDHLDETKSLGELAQQASTNLHANFIGRASQVLEGIRGGAFKFGLRVNPEVGGADIQRAILNPTIDYMRMQEKIARGADVGEELERLADARRKAGDTNGPRGGGSIPGGGGGGTTGGSRGSRGSGGQGDGTGGGGNYTINFESRPPTREEANKLVEQMKGLKGKIEYATGHKTGRRLTRERLSEIEGITPEMLSVGRGGEAMDVASQAIIARNVIGDDPGKIQQFAQVIGMTDSGGHTRGLFSNLDKYSGLNKGLGKAIKTLYETDPGTAKNIEEFIAQRPELQGLVDMGKDNALMGQAASYKGFHDTRGGTKLTKSQLAQYEEHLSKAGKHLEKFAEYTEKSTTALKESEKTMYKEMAAREMSGANIEAAKANVPVLASKLMGASNAEERTKIQHQMTQQKSDIRAAEAELSAPPPKAPFLGGVSNFAKEMFGGWNLMHLQRVFGMTKKAMGVGDAQVEKQEAAARAMYSQMYGAPETPYLSPQAQRDRGLRMMSSGVTSALPALASDLMGPMGGDIFGSAVAGLGSMSLMGTFGPGIIGTTAATALTGPLGLLIAGGALAGNIYSRASDPAMSMVQGAHKYKPGGLNISTGWNAFATGFSRKNVLKEALPGVDLNQSAMGISFDNMQEMSEQVRRMRGEGILEGTNKTGYSLSYGLDLSGYDERDKLNLAMTLAQEDEFAALGEGKDIGAAMRSVEAGLAGPQMFDFARAYGVYGEEGLGAFAELNQRLGYGVRSKSDWARNFGALLGKEDMSEEERDQAMAVISSGLGKSWFSRGRNGLGQADLDVLTPYVSGTRGSDFVSLANAMEPMRRYGMTDVWSDQLAQNDMYLTKDWSPEQTFEHDTMMASAARAADTQNRLISGGATQGSVLALGGFVDDTQASLNALSLANLSSSRTALGMTSDWAALNATPEYVSFAQQQTQAVQGAVGRGITSQVAGQYYGGAQSMAQLRMQQGIASLDPAMMAVAEWQAGGYGSQGAAEWGSGALPMGIGGQLDVNMGNLLTMAIYENERGGTGLYNRFTMGSITDADMNTIFKTQDWRSEPDPHGLRALFQEGGLRGVQEEQRKQNLAQAGIAGASAQLSFAFTTGVGLEKYKTVDPRTGKRFDIPKGGAWGLQERQMDLSGRQQEYNFAYQEEQMAMQRSQFYENLGLQREQTMAQRGWAQEDWAYQDQTRAMQWGWKQEDFQESVRFMTGRERTLAERSQGRDTIMHNIQEEQIDRQRQRQEEVWSMEDRRFEKTKSHFEEQSKLQDERLEKMKEFYQESRKLQEEQFELSKAQFIESNRLQQASASTFNAYASDMMIDINEMIEDRLAELGLTGTGQTDTGGLVWEPGTQSGRTAKDRRDRAAPVRDLREVRDKPAPATDPWQDVVGALGDMKFQTNQTIDLHVELETPWGFTDKVTSIVNQILAGVQPMESGGGGGKHGTSSKNLPKRRFRPG